MQWLNGRVLDSRPRGHGFEPHRHHCVVSLSKNINPSLVLVLPRKTPFITGRLLMGRKESNQTNKRFHRFSFGQKLTLDYPLLSDTISFGLPIVYFKGSWVEFLNYQVFLSLKVVLILANCADSDEIWVFTVCLSSRLVNKGASQPQHGNQEAMAPQPLG